MSQARALPASRTQKLLIATDRFKTPLYWWYEKRLAKAVLGGGKKPRHLGIILDGNRRFARSVGLQTQEGHDYGAHKAYEVLEWCLELGIPHVTLWVFSSDNKSRDPGEVAHLLELFAREAGKMVVDERIHKNRVRIKLIGQLEDFPENVRDSLRELEAATQDYDGLMLHIAIGYGGREEIVGAVRSHLKKQLEDGVTLEQLTETLSVDDLDAHMYTAGTPDPDFIIRTSGEVRLSGFLLWQSAYSEYYFCDAYWPSFRRLDFLRALRSFQSRERRFGR